MTSSPPSSVPPVATRQEYSALSATRPEIYRASADGPLEVPENAVVVPGSRAVKKGKGVVDEWDISLYTPVIVKYRDEKTEGGIELEEWLR